jgi:hypothetical protein
MRTTMRRVRVRAAMAALMAGTVLVLAPQTGLAAVVDGTAGADVLHGTDQADTINGFKGADKIYGEGGEDRLYGNDGADELFGGPGPDHFHGGPGDDVIHARASGGDWIECGRGRDVAYVDREDLIVDATAAAPNGSCEVVKPGNPYVLPIAMSDATGGPADYFNAHHDNTPAADISAAAGTPIRAVRTGYVIDAGLNPAGQTWCGYGVLIKATDGAQYIYCHMQAGSVEVAAGIVSGRLIGHVGCTGRCWGNHLHLQIFVPDMSDFEGNSRCPAPLLKAIHQDRPVPRPNQLPTVNCSA